MTKYTSSTERDLHQQLDAKKEYASFIDELRNAWEARDAKKIQTLLGEFVHLVFAQQVMKMFDDGMPFSDMVLMANKLKPDYLVPPKQEFDIGRISFSITRPKEIEAEEPKRITDGKG